MSSSLAASMDRAFRSSPTLLFLRRWMANPKSVASVAPSSPALARLMARFVRREADEVVVEYGGGTGAITRGLLAAGVPPSRLLTIERDPELAAFLRRKFPDVTVLEGDVRDIDRLLPPEFKGKVGTVVVSLPFVLIGEEDRRRIVDGIFQIMPKGRPFLSYTYSARSPLPIQEMGIEGRRVGFALANIPPASVWAFTQAE